MDKFNFNKVILNVNKMKQELPVKLANVTLLHFNNSFREQGYEGQPWKVPQRRIEGTPEYKYPKNKGLGRRTSATLVRSGKLRRTVATSKRQVTFERISFEVNLPYAVIHNYGLEMKNGKRMPQRTFMKDTQTLRNLQITNIKEYINKLWA